MCACAGTRVMRVALRSERNSLSGSGVYVPASVMKISAFSSSCRSLYILCSLIQLSCLGVVASHVDSYENCGEQSTP